MFVSRHHIYSIIKHDIFYNIINHSYYANKHNKDTTIDLQSHTTFENQILFDELTGNNNNLRP